MTKLMEELMTTEINTIGTSIFQIYKSSSGCFYYVQLYQHWCVENTYFLFVFYSDQYEK